MIQIVEYFKKYKLLLIGGVIGAIAGYLYWYYIGCNSGTCPITSSYINSAIYGASLGALLFSMFSKSKKTTNE